jgi:hypothetical protein
MPKFIIKLLLLFFLISSCNLDLGTGDCTTLKQVANNSKTKKAVLLENNGNATVDNSLQVSVVDFNYQVSKKDLGNTFIVDRDHGKTILDSLSIGLTWTSQDTLQIDYDKKLRTFTQVNNINGVTIIYKPR